MIMAIPNPGPSAFMDSSCCCCSPPKVYVSSGSSAMSGARMSSSRMPVARPPEITAASTSAVTLTTRWPSWRRMAVGDLPELREATRRTGTSAPVAVRTRERSMSVTELRCSSGRRTYTRTSSRPRCTRTASAPKTAARVCPARSSRVRPRVRASGSRASWISGIPGVWSERMSWMPPTSRRPSTTEVAIPARRSGSEWESTASTGLPRS